MERFDIVKEEEQVLDFWKQNKIFEKSALRETRGKFFSAKKKPFVFFEGPPTANGRPGIHHVISRAFKDIILRYKTMRGFWVWRRAGWDTHGLPVELQVEKELGLKNKKEIESYGIAKFNQKCRESVWKYREEWEHFTERMGFWIDMADPYITYEPQYIENLWAVLKKFWASGLLFEDFKVVPYCVRCGTPVSSHEVAQGYESIRDRSVYVKFKVPEPITHNLEPNTYLLAWTTTPWTLPGNVALAVGENIEYAAVRVGEENYIVAKDRAHEILGAHEIVTTLRGRELVGLEYEPLFEVPELKSEKSYKVYAADFVSTEEGTGIVHTAVMYGVDDFELGTKIGLPKFHTVTEEGRFIESVSAVGGRPIVSGTKKDTETEEAIIDYLKNKNLLFKEESYEHEYPFCWRCSTPLLYYARRSWFLNVTKKKEDLIKNNQKINWIPQHLRDGRFGEWLREVKDWAISRERYWGTPLPIWKCGQCAHTEAMGSLNELNKHRCDKPTTFVLIRHGEALSNVRMLASSWPETFENGLTDKGRADIERAAEKLKKPDVIYSSDLTRTRQTAEILARALGVEVRTDERLREISFGAFKGHSIKEYNNFFKFVKEMVFKRSSQGESWFDVRKRMAAFADEINLRHAGKTVLVVSHGLPLIILESVLAGVDNEELSEWHEKYELKPAEFHTVEFPNWPFNKAGELDLHRPYIDEIKLKCSKCGGEMSRVRELADVWFDSGAMPFAQGGPDKRLGEPVPSQFPADYIAEGVDQTRGWFYTLHVVSTLLGRGPAYRTVISNGHVLDKDGKKMSKSRGNVVDPWEVIAKYGIDAIRWYFFTVNPPGEPKRFNEEDVGERYRRFVMTVINSLIFLETYWTNTTNTTNNLLDRWILSRLADEVETTTKLLDDYDIVTAARRLDKFVDDFSNWYIRRSRGRPEALPTLAEVLLVLSKTLAPFTPFLAEIVFTRVNRLVGGSVESVHLAEWPKAGRRDQKLESGIELVRSLSSVALAERAKAGIKVRQKLSSLSLNPDDFQRVSGLAKILADEVNVSEITINTNVPKNNIRLDTTVTPALEKEGILRELTRATNDLRREAGLTPAQSITLFYHATRPDGAEEAFKEFQKELSKHARASEIVFKREPHGVLDREREWEDRGWKLWVGIKKL